MQVQVKPSFPHRQEEEIDLTDYVRVLVKRKKLIFASAALFTTVAATGTFLLPNVYQASATLMPIEQDNSNNLGALLSSVGGGLGVLAAQAGLGGDGAAEKFITILRTRTLTEAVISKTQLMPVLFDSRWDAQAKRWKPSWLPFSEHPPSMQDAVKAMENLVSISKNKDNHVISISFKAKDPQLAAKVTNAYVTELDDYLKNNALSTAKRNRLFIEEQLRQTQTDMADLEVSLKRFQQKNRVVSLDAQAQASVQAYADLKSKLVAAEIELRLLEKSTLEGDPRYSLKKQEVTELGKQLKELEQGNTTGPLVSFQQAPSLGLDFARLKRDLMVREKVYELLTQQYEIAKIQEAREDISFQVLDPAIAPEKKASPKRGLLIAAALVGSMLVSIMLAFLLEYWSRAKERITQSPPTLNA